MMDEVEFRGARRIPRMAAREASRGVLLLGEDNPLSVDPGYALWNAPPNCAGERLQRLILGLSGTDYLACWRTNLCTGRWSMHTARARARELLEPGAGDAPDAPWTTVVMLGRKVAQAVGKAHARDPLDVWACEMIGDITLISIPHPSGRNLIWNDPAAIARARARVAHHAPGLYTAA